MVFLWHQRHAKVVPSSPPTLFHINIRVQSLSPSGPSVVNVGDSLEAISSLRIVDVSGIRRKSTRYRLGAGGQGHRISIGEIWVVAIWRVFRIRRLIWCRSHGSGVAEVGR